MLLLCLLHQITVYKNCQPDVPSWKNQQSNKKKNIDRQRQNNGMHPVIKQKWRTIEGNPLHLQFK